MVSDKRDKQSGYLWVEEGEPKALPIITVAPVAPVDKVYTFTASKELTEQLRVGQRVLVPFGRRNRPAPAFVISIDTGPWSSTLKPVDSILDPAGELSPHLLELGRWMARHYCCPLGRTLAAMVPAAVRRQSGYVTVRLASLARPLDDIQPTRLGAKQRAILDRLGAADGPLDVGRLLEETQSKRATLRSLISKGWVTETVSKQAPKLPDDHSPGAEPDFALNSAQQGALSRVEAAVEAEAFRALVLFGVSGSGKTEVYVRAIRRLLARGRQAIMLVPEIALTTQLVQRLAARFERVAVVHSGLTDVQRSLTWEAIRSGDRPVVIGTRSAVFAPCPDLGLFVVDEEQETSYKNLQSPRFGVRDVALKRAHLLKIPIILGSATPSLETWHNLHRLPSYERIDLPQRVRALPMPTVRLVDMGNERIVADRVCCM